MLPAMPRANAVHNPATINTAKLSTITINMITDDDKKTSRALGDLRHVSDALHQPQCELKDDKAQPYHHD